MAPDTGPDRNDAAADAEWFGLSLTAEDLAPGECGALWRQNLPALEAFMTMATQWNCIGLADGSCKAVGLNYAGARAALDLAGLDVTPDLWADVQLIELGAREAMNGAQT